MSRRTVAASAGSRLSSDAGYGKSRASWRAPEKKPRTTEDTRES